MKNPVSVAVLISGKGSNARNLIHYFSTISCVNVSLILATKPNEELELFCKKAQVSFAVITPWEESMALIKLQEGAIDLIVLAGFLRKIGTELLAAFPDKIINLHPSLLPKFGGPGMYGTNVHRKVVESQEQQTGITIHLVNEAYDQGKILAQFSCRVVANDTPESVETKVRALELQYFPQVIFDYCKALPNI